MLDIWELRVYWCGRYKKRLVKTFRYKGMPTLAEKETIRRNYAADEIDLVRL